MFKKTDPNPQLDMFTAPSMQLGCRASKKYSAPNAWHNQFYSLVTTKIDEDIFKPLFPGGKKITSVQVETAVFADCHFLQEAVKNSEHVTNSTIEELYADGAYQSPDNREFAKNQAKNWV